jgi:P-type Cu2+ transporter
VDGNGSAADAEEAGAALAVTPAREGYPLSPASATVVPRPRPGRCPPGIAGTRWQPEGGAPSAQEMMGHGGAAGMSVDSMVRDMRNRFLVAAAFSVPISLWSPIGRNVLGFTVAAPFGLRDDVWLLLSLPVIVYSSWIFFDGAVAALLATGVSLAVAAAVASIARWGPTSSPACCSRSPTR